MQYLLMFSILCGSLMLAYLINIPIKNKYDMLLIFDNLFKDYFSYENNSKFPFVYYIKKYNSVTDNVYAKAIIRNFNTLTKKNTDINEINDIFIKTRSAKPFAGKDEVKLLNIILIIFKFKNSFKNKKDLITIYDRYKALSKAQVLKYKSNLRINYILTVAAAMVLIILII